MKTPVKPLFSAYLAKTKLCTLLVLLLSLVLSGCLTTQKSRVAVGPAVANGKTLADKSKSYPYHSNIYLDVAIPVFDPGIPPLFTEQKEQNIWPQLRRSEANRFALSTKRALEATAVFGNVSVVPTPQATADLFVLGKILASDSEEVAVEIELVDITGKVWDREEFSHTVDLSFYRDKKNDGKDAYQPLFTEIADHIYSLLIKLKESDKATIKQITQIRFAQSLSPEAFADNLAVDRNGILELKQLPSESDPMLARVQPLMVQEQMFIDRIQTQYEAFGLKTDESYYEWQKETLPAMHEARAARNSAIFKGILGSAIVAAAVIAGTKGGKSDASKVLAGAVAIGGGLLIKDALGDNSEAKIHKATIDEAGESLDIEMSPQVITLEDKTLDLTGTAKAQFIQWKAHLREIYALEQTPEQQL